MGNRFIKHLVALIFIQICLMSYAKANSELKRRSTGVASDAVTVRRELYNIMLKLLLRETAQDGGENNFTVKLTTLESQLQLHKNKLENIENVMKREIVKLIADIKDIKTSMVEKDIEISRLERMFEVCNRTCSAENAQTNTTFDMLEEETTSVNPTTNEISGTLSADGWPSGTYGLYKTTSGCPLDGRWEIGSRFHDTEDYSEDNAWSAEIKEHMKGPFMPSNIRNHFCIKTTENFTSNDPQWQPGSYCLLKKGNCPSGFSGGYFQWDDEDRNMNQVSGTLPDGTYNKDTIIYYCCREDGSQSTPITLPTSKPFYLSRKGGSCQSVTGMRVVEEWMRYNCEDSHNDIITSSYGSTPDHLLIGNPPDLKLYFCYYYK